MLWPTPTVSGNNNRAGLTEKSGDGLATSVRRYSTPNTRGIDGGSRSRKAAKLNGTFVLNPDWVEWLMGWPMGWTSLEPLPVQEWARWRFEMTGGSWWRCEPPIPRTKEREKGDRARIKALGNGQVPLTAMMAWQLLRREM